MKWMQDISRPDAVDKTLGKSFLAVMINVLCILLAVLVSARAQDALLKQVLDVEPNRHLQQLGQISDRDGSLSRTYLSPAHGRAAKQLRQWMEAAGLESWVDVIGNIHGRINGSNPSVPAVLLGSHYDTVHDGGKYDGALGIIVGLSAIKAAVIKAGLEAGQQLPEVIAEGEDVVLSRDFVSKAETAFNRPIHLVAFADEEGLRFQSTFLGSRALAGKLVHYGMLKAMDKQGQTLEEVLRANNDITGDVAEAVQASAMPAKDIEEYLEVHIEQGPVLERVSEPLGVVSGIAGQTRLWATINGTQGHAGTVPMHGRADPLAAAAAVVLAVEAACGGGGAPTPEEAKIDMLVCTVGELQVWPGASNVIPGQVQLSLDIRAQSDALRNNIVDQVLSTINNICEKRGVSCGVKRTHDAAAVLSDPGMVAGLQDAIRETQKEAAGKVLCRRGGSDDGGDNVSQQQCSWEGGEGDGKEVPVLVSGAGHDAMAIAEIAKMAMMFVRCRGGISHNPLEHVEPQDVQAATAALTQYLIVRLAR